MMSRFIYQAKSEPGNLVKGVMEAGTKEAAIASLSRKGLFLLEISEKSETSSSKLKLNFVSKRVTSRQISIFTRQLSDLLQSGLTVVKALDTLSQQTENRKLQQIIKEIRDTVKKGKPFSEGLGSYPDIFSHLYVSMVRSGEVGGALENILEHLAEFTEKEDELKAKINSALIYPALIALVGIATIIVILTFVVPKLVTLFDDLNQNLPLSTKILVALSDSIRRYWWLLSAAGLSGFFVIRKFLKSQKGKIALDKLKLSWPVIGRIVRKGEIARLERTLGTLLTNGVPVLRAMKVVLESIDNMALKAEVEKIYKDVSQGSSFASSMKKRNVFPLFVTNMVAVGEEGGSLERSLLRIADVYEREVDRDVKTLTSMLEPAMILVIGIIVGVMVISMLLPVFQLNLMVY